jgi:hypothetical protein
LAAHRSPESYVAGSTPLHRDGPRFSSDIDIFHHREEQVAVTAAADGLILAGEGFLVEWIRQEPGIHAALVQRHGDSTRLEWVRDSDYRFYPAVADELFGYTLHMIDIVTNKALAAAGREVPRDVLDLLYIHETHLPLGAVIWAAVGKDPGYSPESLINEIRRNARYRADDYAALPIAEPIDAGDVARRLSARCRLARKVCCFWKMAGLCSPIPRGLGTMRNWQAVVMAYGQPLRKSVRRCLNTRWVTHGRCCVSKQMCCGTLPNVSRSRHQRPA